MQRLWMLQRLRGDNMKFTFYIFLGLYQFYIFYLAIMTLYRAKLEGTLTPTAKVIGFPILLCGTVFDVFFNFTLFALIFWERPQEWLLTARLQRYIKNNNDWRRRWAKSICRRLLNFADPSGRHCG